LRIANESAPEQTSDQAMNATTASGRGPGPCGPEPGESVNIVMTLFKSLGQLDTTIDFEQSFKMAAGRLFENRFLLGLARSGDPHRLDGQLGSICKRIGMPKALLSRFAHDMNDADHVYFGIEKDDDAITLKTYLEYRRRFEPATIGTAIRRPPGNLFVGYKWVLSEPSRQSVTEYAWQPDLPLADIRTRVSAHLAAAPDRRLAGIAADLVGLVAARLPCTDIQYLEVSEHGNPRRSFDINLYKSGYRLLDVEHLLAEAALCFGISRERFKRLCDRAGPQRFGHLAAGVDRRGNAFMTCYYGASKIQGSQLRGARVVGGKAQAERALLHHPDSRER
jgi:hypothetical protein